MNFVAYHRNFKKQLKKLPDKIREKFYSKLKIFVANPYLPELNNHSLSGGWTGCRSIDVTGDIRAIYANENGISRFKAIGTHHQLYGK